MRTLSDTLLEAQKGKSLLPYIKVQVKNRVAGITRLDWERLYQGSEDDGLHAATMPGDGSLIRLRTASPGGALYRQRVTSPGPESDFSQWTEWGAPGGAWLSGYGYRKQITINGSTAGAQTNYQMKLRVHKGSGSDSGGDVYLNNHCQDDFDDVRFTKSDGTTELDHWRESYVSGDYAIFWIEFDTIPASPDHAHFYIYYSNAGAASGSNGDNTFLFFDDFPGASLDTNKWQGDTANWSVSGGNAQCSTDAKKIYNKTSYGNVAVETRMQTHRAGGTGSVHPGSLGRTGTYWYQHELRHADNTIKIYNSNGWGTVASGSCTIALDTWYRCSFTLVGSALALTVDGASISGTDADYASGYVGLRAGIYNATGTMYVDFIAVRNLASPEPAWGTWGSEETPEGGTYAVALCSREAEVLAFRIGVNGHLYRCESSDNGANWGSWIDMGAITGTASNFRVAACHKGNGDAIVLHSNGTILYRRRRISGSWESAVEWTNSLQSISGISVFHEGDWNTIITGVDSAGQKGVWTCVYGDGYSQSPGVWSALAELTKASAGSNVEFLFPSLSFPDVFRTFFIEKYTGVSSYSRPFWSHSLASAEFISNLWREPVPFDLYSSYGLALTYHGSYAWLSAPFGVWRAPFSLSAVDVSQDVIGLNFSAEPFSGKARIELRNDDGRYGNIGTGSYAAICPGAEVAISPGYRTEAGAEVSSGPAYWIEGWEYISEGAQAVFILQAADGWTLLEHWKARRQFSWSAGSKNVFQLLAFIFARAGLEFSAFSNSEEMVNHYPAFAIHPGESGASAVRHLLEMVPDVLSFRGHYGYIRNPKASDSSSYSYGVDHALWQGRYSQLCPQIDRVQVFGDGVLSEGFDWSGISKVYDRLH